MNDIKNNCDEIDLVELFKIILKRKFFILILMILSVIIVLLLSKRKEPNKFKIRSEIKLGYFTGIPIDFRPDRNLQKVITQYCDNNYIIVKCKRKYNINNQLVMSFYFSSQKKNKNFFANEEEIEVTYDNRNLILLFMSNSENPKVIINIMDNIVEMFLKIHDKLYKNIINRLKGDLSKNIYHDRLTRYKFTSYNSNSQILVKPTIEKIIQEKKSNLWLKLFMGLVFSFLLGSAISIILSRSIIEKSK